MKKIYFFLGTTAELIKVAPVIKELKRRKIGFKIIASGQSPIKFNELKSIIGRVSAGYTFKLKPFKYPRNIYLRFLVWSIKSNGNYFLYFRNKFRKSDKKNLLFIVHGDTVSSLFGAIVAKIYGVRLVHIESGLRSFNFLEPFPEEISRFIISWLSDIHFCPNAWAMNNLKNHPGVKVNTLHNTIGESLWLTLKAKAGLPPRVPRKNKFFVLIMHRQEHVMLRRGLAEQVLREVIKYANTDLKCLLIMHRLTGEFIRGRGLFPELKSNPNIVLLPRISYPAFVNILSKAQFMVTDGGSNQEELYFLGKPCLIIRRRTERIEGLGENALIVGNDRSKIKNFFKNYKKYKRKKVFLGKNPPSKIIVDYLTKDVNFS